MGLDFCKNRAIVSSSLNETVGNLNGKIVNKVKQLMTPCRTKSEEKSTQLLPRRHSKSAPRTFKANIVTNHKTIRSQSNETKTRTKKDSQKFDFCEKNLFGTKPNEPTRGQSIVNRMLSRAGAGFS